MCVCASVHILAFIYGKQRIVRISSLSPSTKRILELELRLPGLVARTLVYWAIFSAYFLSLCSFFIQLLWL